MTLLAAYNFDGTGDTIVDRSGNGHDFSIAAANATRTTGHTGQGLTKTAAGGEPVVAEPAFGQTADRTLMCWIQGDDGVWWARWQVDTINSGSWGLLLLSGAVGVQARNATGFVRPSVPAPGDGLWHHWAATYTEATGAVVLYRDGAEVASDTLAGPLRTDADRIDIAHWDHIPNAVMDDLRVYDEALSAAQITDLMNTPVTDAAQPVSRVRIPDGAGGWKAAAVRTFNGSTWVDASVRTSDGAAWS